MFKLSLVWIMLFVLSCSYVFADENEKNISLDQNISNSIDMQNDSKVVEKIKAFFGGIVDDAIEFAVDNRIIDNR